MYIFKVAVFFAVIPFILATDCTVSDSSAWPYGDSSGGSSSGGGSGTDACAQFDNDPAQYQACEKNVLQGQCNSVGGDDCPDSSDSSDGSGNGGLIRRLEARGTLSCNSDETCYQYTNGSLVCYDMTTSDYHDDAGGKGNLIAGTYTAPGGDVTRGTTSTASGSGRSTATNSNDSTPTRTGTSGRNSTSSTAGASSDAATATGTKTTGTATTGNATTGTKTTGTGTSGTATSASVTPKSGGEVLRAHAVVGALGLGAAFIL